MVESDQSVLQERGSGRQIFLVREGCNQGEPWGLGVECFYHRKIKSRSIAGGSLERQGCMAYEPWGKIPICGKDPGNADILKLPVNVSDVKRLAGVAEGIRYKYFEWPGMLRSRDREEAKEKKS